ncbi:response regulator [Pseudochryseolinea flava]|uniref:Response regulator n=1 Tax=Pseudochryseolinea flava TaxID=2059302 RepID=A0A364Y0F8_9BACT|nr:response regulator [Pseudochryseolinea flava]RAW00282.1 response regulator [Pseudochryseolinea flava]
MLNILLIEDDQDDIDLMQDALNDNSVDCSIMVIKQGDKAIPYLESCKKFPDVILLDLNLPKIHGREILDSIKSSHSFKDIPVVILTTSSSKEDIESCLKAGANSFITKPYTVDGFKETVSAIIEVAEGKYTSERTIQTK